MLLQDCYDSHTKFHHWGQNRKHFLFLVKKEKVVLFNKERVWQQGHASGKKNGAGTCLVALLAFATILPAYSNSVWQNCLGTFVQSSLTVLQNPTSLLYLLLSIVVANSSPPPSDAMGYLWSPCFPPNPDRFDKLLIYHPTQIFRGKECTLCHPIPEGPDLQEI